MAYKTEHELLFDLVQEIADGKWDGAISAPALRERARLIVYGVADCYLAYPEHDGSCNRRDPHTAPDQCARD